jgi:hypothetical protein
LYQPRRAQGKLAVGQASGQWANWIGLSILVGVAYFLAARLSLLLLTKPDGVAVFWPASGVAAGALVALGPRARLPVAAGAAVATIVANLMGDRSILSAFVFALCNAGEALLTGWLIQRYFGRNFALDRLSQLHRANSIDLATLVRVRRARNSDRRTADHRVRICCA